MDSRKLQRLCCYSYGYSYSCRDLISQFLAALSSSRSLVVCPSVGPSVSRSVGPLTFVKK